jgi:hypothetical protein
VAAFTQASPYAVGAAPVIVFNPRGEMTVESDIVASIRIHTTRQSFLESTARMANLIALAERIYPVMTANQEVDEIPDADQGCGVCTCSKTPANSLLTHRKLSRCCEELTLVQQTHQMKAVFSSNGNKILVSARLRERSHCHDGLF